MCACAGVREYVCACMCVHTRTCGSQKSTLDAIIQQLSILGLGTKSVPRTQEKPRTLDWLAIKPPGICSALHLHHYTQPSYMGAQTYTADALPTELLPQPISQPGETAHMDTTKTGLNSRQVCFAERIQITVKGSNFTHYHMNSPHYV